MRRSAGLGLAIGLVVVGAGNASARDYWELGANNDNGTGTSNELFHGTSQQHDLEAIPGPVADRDWYVAVNYAGSSYEVIVDSTGGDIVPGLALDRFALNGSTLLQAGEVANSGVGLYSLALRWQNTDGLVNYLRVGSAGCTTTCGSQDQYHIRYYDTTVAVPRFNNAGGQVTVLIIQNPTGWSRLIAGTVYFWNAAGTLLGSTTFGLAPKAALVLNTGTVPGVAGQSGTITIAHDGGYGNLAIKSVALEPATGFSFDTPGLYKLQ